MLLKLIVSFLCGVLFVYFMFCMLITINLIGVKRIEDVPADIKHRWFCLVSIYLGHAIAIIIIITILTIVPYVIIFAPR